MMLRLLRQVFRSQLRINIAVAMGSKLLATLLQFICYPIYLHFLGYERYGLWLVLATLIDFAQLGNLGIANALTKLIATAKARDDHRAMESLAASGAAILLAIGLALALVMTIARSPIANLLSTKPNELGLLIELLPYVAALTPCVFLTQMVYGIVAGLGRMDLASYLQLATRVVTLGLATALFLSGFDLWSLLIAQFVGFVFSIAAGTVVVERIGKLSFFRFGVVSRSTVRALLAFGSTVVGGSWLLMLLGPFNKLLIGRYLGMEHIARYELAYVGASQVRNLIEEGMRAVMPEISRIDAGADNTARRRIAVLHWRLVGFAAFWAAPVYGVALVFAELILRLWLGNEFHPDLPILWQICLVGSFINLLGTPAYYSLMGMGHVRSCLGAYALQSLINVLGVGILVLGLGSRSLPAVMSVVAGALAIGGTFLLVRHHIVVSRQRFSTRSLGANNDAVGLQ